MEEEGVDGGDAREGNVEVREGTEGRGTSEAEIAGEYLQNDVQVAQEVVTFDDCGLTCGKCPLP